MKKYWIMGIAVLAAVSVTGTVLAAGSEMKMEPPKPAAELSAMNYFNGHWGCTGHVLANDMMIPPHATSATVSSNLDLNGFWRTFRYTERKTKENPTPWAVIGSWGYDSTQKKFVQFAVDNMGASSTAWSTGWNGDTIIIEGESVMMGQKTMARDNFTKRGADEFMHTGEFQGKDGSWAKFDEETCKKAASKTAAVAAPPAK